MFVCVCVDIYHIELKTHARSERKILIGFFYVSYWNSGELLFLSSGKYTHTEIDIHLRAKRIKIHRTKKKETIKTWMKNNANKEKTNEEEEENFAERLTIFFLISANKDEIAMKSTAEVKENEGIKKKKNKRENYNTIVLFCLYQWRKKNVHLTNLRECRISAVRDKKKKQHREQINKT